MPRPRRPESYARGAPKREPYASVLIVCEGSKAEPNYLLGLRSAYRLSSANIRITPADGTDPLSVVEFAEAEFDRGGYDLAFCVFDRDEHPNFPQAINRILQLDKFCAIPSCPCFEIWILLHFAYSAAPRARDEALSEVIKHYNSYTKGSKTSFQDLAPRLVNAIRNSRRLEADNRRTGADNPATKMHVLVEYLIGLRK